MASHNSILGKPAHANSYVINNIFREECGFGDGIIVSDCNDIEALMSFNTAANLSQAAARALNAGVDLDLQCGRSSAYTHLNESLADGLLSSDTIKTAARRVLMAKFAMGVFDKPYTNESSGVLNSSAHINLALRAAEEGIVLLKNDKNILPLSSKYKRVAVMGQNGGCDEGKCFPCIQNMLGSYTEFDGTVQVQCVAEALNASLDGVVQYSLGSVIADVTPKTQQV